MSTRSQRHRLRSSQGAARPFDGMRQRNIHAAGVASGAHAMMACHKIARTAYHMLKDQVPYYAIGAAEYNQRFRERELQY